MKEARLLAENFFKASLLTSFDPDAIFTIAFFGTDEVTGPNGTENKLMLRFEESHLALVLSGGRVRQLDALHGEDVVGKKISLGVEKGNQIVILAAAV